MSQTATKCAVRASHIRHEAGTDTCVVRAYRSGRGAARPLEGGWATVRVAGESRPQGRPAAAGGPRA